MPGPFGEQEYIAHMIQYNMDTSLGVAEGFGSPTLELECSYTLELLQLMDRV